MNTKIKIAIFALSMFAFALLIVPASTSAAPTFQSSILPTPEALPTGELSLLPVVMKSGAAPTPTPNPIQPCDPDDPYRGSLYRELVTNTTVLLWPLMDWATTACTCGLSTSQANGAAVGSIAGKVFRIVRATVGIIWTAVQAAVSLIGSIIDLVLGDAMTPSIVCTGDAEYICFGIAAIASLDGMADGLITVFVLLLLAFLTFYLGMYVVRQVRELMEPSGGED